MFKTQTLLLTLLIIVNSINLFAQNKVVSGTVYDEQGDSIPWVNIGIRNKDVGTISNASGKFELPIPSQFQTGTVVFSFVGFHERSIPVSEMINQKGKAIILFKKTYVLNEVLISGAKRRKANLGTTNYTPLIWMAVSLRGTGKFAEPAQLIKIKHPVKLLTANARVGGLKKSQDSTTYRLNIYKVQNGLPGGRLIERSFMKTFPETDKTLTFDLKDESIYIDQDFVVAFEYIPKTDSTKNGALSFRASITGSGGFSRTASIGQWSSVQGAAPSIFVHVE